MNNTFICKNLYSDYLKDLNIMWNIDIALVYHRSIHRLPCYSIDARCSSWDWFRRTHSANTIGPCITNFDRSNLDTNFRIYLSVRSIWINRQ